MEFQKLSGESEEGQGKSYLTSWYPGWSTKPGLSYSLGRDVLWHSIFCYTCTSLYGVTPIMPDSRNHTPHMAMPQTIILKCLNLISKFSCFVLAYKISYYESTFFFVHVLCYQIRTHELIKKDNCRSRTSTGHGCY